jgi:hypothetical protein
MRNQKNHIMSSGHLTATTDTNHSLDGSSVGAFEESGPDEGGAAFARQAALVSRCHVEVSSSGCSSTPRSPLQTQLNITQLVLRTATGCRSEAMLRLLGGVALNAKDQAARPRDDVGNAKLRPCPNKLRVVSKHHRTLLGTACVVVSAPAGTILYP